MEKAKKKPELSEAELKRLIALDRAAVEESLSRNKANGRKYGAIIAVAIVIVTLVVIFTFIAIDYKR